MPKIKKKLNPLTPQLKLKSNLNSSKSTQNKSATNSNISSNQDVSRKQDKKDLKRKFNNSEHQQNGQNQNKKAKVNKQYPNKLQSNQDGKNKFSNAKIVITSKNQSKEEALDEGRINKKNKKSQKLIQKQPELVTTEQEIQKKQANKSNQNKNNIDKMPTNSNGNKNIDTMPTKNLNGNKKQLVQGQIKSSASLKKVQQNTSYQKQSEDDLTNEISSIVPNSNWDKMRSQVSGNSKSKKPNHKSSKQSQNGPQKNIHDKINQAEINLKTGQKAEDQSQKSDHKNLSIEELNQKKDDEGLTKVIAVDCEMVGVGFEGGQSVVARVSIVNDFGNVIYDVHVRPKMRVTDFRTKWSGIRPSDLKNAVSFEEMQQQVAQILKGRIVVGHSLQNDLKVLQIGHPKRLIRDTARYPPLLYQKSGRLRPRALKHLAKEQLQLDIQDGEHSSVEDARAVLYIYHKFRETWEQQISNGELQGYKRQDANKNAQQGKKKGTEKQIDDKKKEERGGGQ
eukprot:TRINITY_DN299_c0_g3_i4.p1 TRINITY_DN299_c0_g3~~TRINITY_DN299_c0_g3_i4.p1  ORF type:complete len:507 (+),score=65.80 TRINITY_DN299_c0_g3_i4:314-1834(+)